MFHCNSRCVCGEMTWTFLDVARRSATCVRVTCSHPFLQSNCSQLIIFGVGTKSDPWRFLPRSSFLTIF